MKKITNLTLAVAMIFSIAFIGETFSSNGNLSVQAQNTTVKKKRKRGIIRKTFQGGKWVTRKVYRGGRWVTVKTWKTGRKVVSRTKKVVY